ncbi:MULTISPECIES: hypothetical protein [Sphingobium]|uniref:hypothetical protein n=1 Tax=Sphingobium TaxID=165695 RepID=UPI001BEB2609|nr:MULTISPECIES: hypothetical protein [Sphingobium]MBT2245039.1 hypothetical protein [Sphingobium sp. BHU LFT2]WBQ19397.1 hypothetical protein PAE53_23760 [Sphingobium yanoikuyae]
MTEDANHVRLSWTASKATMMCQIADVEFTHIAEGGGRRTDVICRMAAGAERLRQLFLERIVRSENPT